MTLDELFPPVIVSGFRYGFGPIVNLVHPYQFIYIGILLYQKPSKHHHTNYSFAHIYSLFVTILHNVNLWVLVFVFDMFQDLLQARWIYHYPHWSWLQINNTYLGYNKKMCIARAKKKILICIYTKKELLRVP